VDEKDVFEVSLVYHFEVHAEMQLFTSYPQAQCSENLNQPGLSFAGRHVDRDNVTCAFNS